MREIRERYFYVAIDRCSRFVHLAVYDAENAANAVAFLAATRKASPFRITHILTYRGSCFSADAFDGACAKLKIPHRITKPDTPQTNGMVERFNGRVASEVLGINVAGHADLETLLTGFNHAYSRRRQRVLNAKTPLDTISQHIEFDARLANPLCKANTQEDLMNKVDEVLYHADDVSQPYSWEQDRFILDPIHQMPRLNS